MNEDRLITVESDGLDVAIPIVQVREVIPVAEIFPVPGSREPFLGLMVYRDGDVLPLFSLDGLLGQESRKTGNLVVVAQVDRLFFGLPVKRIGGLVQNAELDEPGPEAGGDTDAKPAVLGTVTVGDKRHQVLDLGRFFH